MEKRKEFSFFVTDPLFLNAFIYHGPVTVINEMQAKKNQDNTILDIAALLKLSPATISRALNNHPYVKEKTRKRVQEAAEKLGYRRNILASGLRNRKTNTIGMIVPRISMFFHAAVITSVQTVLYNHGYNLIISQSNDDPEQEKELLQTFYASRVDAILVACALRTTDLTPFSAISEKGTPVLFYDRFPSGKVKANVVRGDDFQGGYLAGTHLAKAGCRRIAHIGGYITSRLYLDRVAGFIKALEENGVKLEEKWIQHHELTAENAKETLAKMFAGKRKPDGIFTANDTTALAVLDFARENGIKVPDELKIVGYSNDPRSSIVNPAVTTIEQFPDRVGLKAAETLLELISGRGEQSVRARFKEVVVPVELISRASS